ncbi:MAG TPA: site-specific integrase, partial [Anaerolineae bacterium]|nr:site-specific integrase [Anaerolineae bacterium]
PVPPSASVQAAIGAFEQHMNEKGFSIHTRKAFISDLRLLGKRLGIGRAVGKIGTKDLNDFLDWLLHERGVPCSPKTYARRVTTIKVFFGWLHEINTLPNDPAAAVVQKSVTSPLPTVPRPHHIAYAQQVTEAWRLGEEIRRPDARPHLLLNLLLQTGIKKGEAMAIIPNHIDRQDESNPYLFVRYKNPRLRYKERKLALSPTWLPVLDEYLDQYAPPKTLFTCTARNLEYVLRDIGEAAKLPTGLLSFENLRWASALNDHRAGTDPDLIRQKLGLSSITWRETFKKLQRLLATETDGEAPQDAPPA